MIRHMKYLLIGPVEQGENILEDAIKLGMKMQRAVHLLADAVDTDNDDIIIYGLSLLLTYWDEAKELGHPIEG